MYGLPFVNFPTQVKDSGRPIVGTTLNMPSHDPANTHCNAQRNDCLWAARMLLYVASIRSK